ncbi:MAG TPA: inositol monophosphatase family protein, partial [Ilumatobacteraceae bacterium]
MTDLDPAIELHVAIELADACDANTFPAFEQRAFTVDRKLDRTEVTEIDRGTEQLVAERLATVRPHHGMFGEEHGLQGDATSPWRWVIDPIDGTSGFVRGIPVWASLIALMNVHDGEVVVGVVSAPALGRRWWAAAGMGTFVNGTPCRVSRVDRVEQAQVSVTFSAGWDDLGLTGELVRLQQQAARARGFGDFWQHALVAEGA